MYARKAAKCAVSGPARAADGAGDSNHSREITEPLPQPGQIKFGDHHWHPGQLRARGCDEQDRREEFSGPRSRWLWLYSVFVYRCNLYITLHCSQN
jgi:hypothetical protein